MKTKHKKLLRKDSRNWSFSSWQTSHCENSERARNFMTSVHFEFQHRRNVTYLMSNRLSCCLLPQMAKAKQKMFQFNSKSRRFLFNLMCRAPPKVELEQLKQCSSWQVLPCHVR